MSGEGLTTGRRSFGQCSRRKGSAAAFIITLTRMVDLVPDENPLKPAMRSVQELAAYATTFRYPTDGGRIVLPRGDINVWIGKVQRLFDEAVAGFGVDISSKDSPAANGGPLR